MRRILTSSTLLLAAALLVVGCGSNSNSVPHPGIPSVASLKGEYVFQEQLYTYYSGANVARPAAGVGRFGAERVMNKVAELPHRAQALQGLHTHASLVRQRQTAMSPTSRNHAASPALGKSSAPVPDQGDQYNTNVAWGASIGSLTFDGDGHITGGEVDYSEPFASIYAADVITSGSYTVNSDQTGTVTAKASSGDYYNFAIILQGSGVATGSAAAGAQLLESNIDEFGDVHIGNGQFLQQTTGLTEASLSGNYVFGVRGETCYGCTQNAYGDLYAAGVLSANGSGTFSSTSQADISTGFNTDNLVTLNGTYTAPDASGRLTAELTSTGYTNGTLPGGYVIYLANSSTAFILATDQSTTSVSAAYLYGQLGLQSTASLSGNYVVAETTEDLQNETVYPDTYSDTYLALLSATGGTFNGTGDINQAGNISSGVAFNYGTYTVAANGRVTLTGTTPSGAPAPVFWLQNSSTGYGIDQLDGTSTQEPGLLFLYQQSGSGFSNGSLTGTDALGTLAAATSNVGLDVNDNEVGPGILAGVVTADGNGNLSGTGLTAYIDGTEADGSFTGTYAVGSTGRGTITGSSDGLFGNEVFYIVSPSVVLSTDVTAGNSAPSIQIFHQ
jgi:hypothetical protein